jgi:hypothetical protein
LILQEFKENKVVIDWEDLVKDVLSHGWSLGPWLTRTENDLNDVLSKDETGVIMERLSNLVFRMTTIT